MLVSEIVPSPYGRRYVVTDNGVEATITLISSDDRSDEERVRAIMADFQIEE